MRQIKVTSTFLFLLTLLAFQGCVDRIEVDTDIDGMEYESIEIIQVTFYGTIKDSDGVPIANAEVSVVNANDNNASTLTDQNGYYEFFDLPVKGNTAIMHVTSNAMWEQEQHISIVKNKIFNANFQLVSFIKTGEFSGSTGGTIDQNNHAELTFDANSIIDETGQTYNGVVEVFVNVIDPLSETSDTKNYGGNLGLDILNNKVGKFSYQILQVELQSPQGNSLNIKPGSTAQVKMLIQSTVSGQVANKDFAVMSYDESKHEWKEELTGFEENGFYTADLPHFSTWTWCELLGDAGNISGQINLLDQGVPYDGVSYVIIDYGFISFLERPSIDGSFLFKCGLHEEEPFTFTVENECQEEIYSIEMEPIMSGTDLGIFNIETPPNYTNQLSANVFNCDLTEVVNGYSRFCIDDLSQTRCQILPIVDGTVSYDFVDCETELVGNLFLLNEESLHTTEPIDVNLNEGDVHLEFVTLCDTFLNNITINVNGSQFYTNHMVDTGGTGPPFRALIGSDSDNGFVSIRVDGQYENLGAYTIDYFILGNSDNSIYSGASGMTDVELILEEFEPNASDPDNPFLRPEHLKASFSGVIDQTDFVTGAVIGTLEIDGTIYID